MQCRPIKNKRQPRVDSSGTWIQRCQDGGQLFEVVTGFLVAYIQIFRNIASSVTTDRNSAYYDEIDATLT